MIQWQVKDLAMVKDLTKQEYHHLELCRQSEDQLELSLHCQGLGVPWEALRVDYHH